MKEFKKVEKKNFTIKLPKGCFEGNCCDCRYADWNDVKDGKPYCRGSYGGYNNPSNRNGCFHYQR